MVSNGALRAPLLTPKEYSRVGERERGNACDQCLPAPPAARTRPSPSGEARCGPEGGEWAGPRVRMGGVNNGELRSDRVGGQRVAPQGYSPSTPAQTRISPHPLNYNNNESIQHPPSYACTARQCQWRCTLPGVPRADPSRTGTGTCRGRRTWACSCRVRGTRGCETSGWPPRTAAIGPQGP